MPKKPPEKIQDIDEMARQIDEALAEARQTLENLAQTKEIEHSRSEGTGAAPYKKRCQ